ncbi:hypothetical protein G6514_008579 [Epicoccum nigrum]|nr:hypothetical protein G6514_008579 [Epicoccum nigrum]
MHEFRLSNHNTSGPARRQDEPESDGRKRRRLVPITVAAEQLSEDVEAEVVQLSKAPNTESPTEPGAWDHLSKWIQADHAIVVDTEEEEVEYSDVSDEASGLAEESEDDREETSVPVEGLNTKPSKLGANTVVEIIQSCIESYELAWTPGKGETQRRDGEREGEVPVIYDPLAMWEEAEAAGQRDELAKKHELAGEYYRQRLDRLCDEIAKDPGNTAAGVRMTCRNLEITVDLIQRATWLEDIYRLSPEGSSDEESQNETSMVANEVQLPPTRLYGFIRHRAAPSQIVDLDTPSDSEDERLAPNATVAMSLQDENGKSEEKGTLSGIPASDLVPFDLIESVETASASPPADVHSRASLGDAPEQSSLSIVSRWSWALLEETKDRKRAVSKAIYELSQTDRETIQQRLRRVGSAKMVREIPVCVSMLSRGTTKMPGILPNDLAKIVTFTKLFMCWWLCGNYFQKEIPETHLMELEEHLQSDSSDVSIFCNYVDTVLRTTFSRKALSCPTKPSQAEIIEISDDDDKLPAKPPRRRKTNLDKLGSQRKTPVTVPI